MVERKHWGWHSGQIIALRIFVVIKFIVQILNLTVGGRKDAWRGA